MKEQTTVCSFFFSTLFFEPFPAIRSKLLASLKGFPLLSGVLKNFVIGTTLLENQRFYSYYVIGKSKILFLLRNSYYVIRNVEDPRCLQPSSKGPSRSHSPSQRQWPSRSNSPSSAGPSRRAHSSLPSLCLEPKKVKQYDK